MFALDMLGEVWNKTIRAPKVNVDGRTFLITGGNSGIGKETARQIAIMNPKKVLDDL
jgi:FlaA1/EpsC-like NDP-sugar epimerase